MRGVSFGVLYVIVGVVVAAVKDYFDNLESLKAVLELLIAILIWPLRPGRGRYQRPLAPSDGTWSSHGDPVHLDVAVEVLEAERVVCHF
jgi:hypothetical protein